MWFGRKRLSFRCRLLYTKHGSTTIPISSPVNFSKLNLSEPLSHLLMTAVIPTPYKPTALKDMHVKCLEQHYVGTDVNIIIINIVSFII